MAKGKKIYLGAALVHAPEVYRRSILDLKKILSEQFEVLDFYGYDKAGEARNVYLHDIDCVKNCDFLLAECSYPSLGLGFEIASALNLNKPVIAVAHKDALVSRMILGIDTPLFTFMRYESISDIAKIISEFAL
ncbi:MAG: hypothetical protein HYV13_00095 [Candidatus Doudnabacteria bacterium]|nr:hypothetical protein [Candidatus Doudnabacteria bacterium]